MIARQIRQRITITGMKVNIELYRSLDSAVITSSDTSKEVLNLLLLLRDIQAIRGRGNLNPKEAAKRTKISHEKLLTETVLEKAMYSESSPMMIMSST